MPTIDTSTIEGFGEMSAEQKLEALLKFEIPEKVDLSGFVSKNIADKYASEAAEYKKQLTAKMTEDEKAKAEADAKEEKYQQLLKKSTIADYKAQYLAAGYSADLAQSTAEALFDGNMEKVLENQKTFHAEQEKKIRADLLKEDPKPSGAGGGSDKPADVKYAEQLAKQRSDTSKKANEGQKFYFN